jgi:hypothetical protein
MHRWHALLGTAIVRSIHHAVITSMERHEGTPATGLSSSSATPSGAGQPVSRSPAAAAVSHAALRAPETVSPPLGLSTYFRRVTSNLGVAQGSTQRVGPSVQ